MCEATFTIFLTFPTCPSHYHGLSQSEQLGKVYDRNPIHSPAVLEVVEVLGALLRDFLLLCHFGRRVRSLDQDRFRALEKDRGPVWEKTGH